MTQDKNILRELSFLEQFLAGVKRIGESIVSLQPAALRLKYRILFSECRFAVNALKWQVEDDISRLGGGESDLPPEQNKASEEVADFQFSAADEIRLQEAAKVIDEVLGRFERQLYETDRIAGWKFSYDRKKGPMELWPIYEEE